MGGTNLTIEEAASQAAGNGAGRPLTAEELMARGRKVVALGDGRSVTIRRLGPSALGQAAGAVLDLAAFLKEPREGEESLPPGPARDRAFETMERVLVQGVLDPRLGTDPQAGPTPSDFDLSEQVALFAAILEHSGYTREAAERVRP